MSGPDRARRVDAAAEALGLSHLLDRAARTLSGAAAGLHPTINPNVAGGWRRSYTPSPHRPVARPGPQRSRLARISQPRFSPMSWPTRAA